MKGGESLCTTYQGRAWKSRCVHGVGSRLQTEDALCFSSLKRERSAGLPFESFQLLSHVCAADLGVASRGLDGRSAFHGDMAKIVGNLFQCPSCLSRSMGEIVPQIMKREVSNRFPLLRVGLAFQRPEPVMNARLGQLRVTLRSKNIWTFGITSTKAKIVIEGTTGFIEQINITELLPFVPHM